MQTIYIIMCHRTGAAEYPVCAFTEKDRADIATGIWNRNAKLLTHYRVSVVMLDPMMEAVRRARV